MNIPGDHKTENIGDNIYITDTLYLNREKFAASYFLVDHGEIAIIETNTNYAVPGILNAVKGSGFDPSDIKYVILTHIHLDHAGGAGKIMNELPNAELIVHPRGARHMISPEKLIESVKYVYGEEKYLKLYGEIQGVPKERVISKSDGDSIMVGNRKLFMIDSPGHAKHHNIIFDELSGSVFSGDAFGIGYPRFKYKKGTLIFPSTSPVQFDPESALKTYKMVADLEPERVFLTHYGSVENVDEIIDQLFNWIDYTVNASLKRYSEDLRGDELNKTLINDLWKKFDSRMIEIRGEPLKNEEKEYLLLDTDLNSKGAAFYITQNNNR